MRAIVCAVVFSLACSGSSGPVAITMATLQGTVQDSLAAKPATGVVVQLGSFTATTDFLGAYQFSGVAAGDYTLSVSASGFEPYSRAISLTTSTTLNIPLRRTRPYLTSYATANNATVLIATVVDLQGQATILSNQSTVFYSYSGGGTLAYLNPATRTVIDPLTVRFQLSTGVVVTSAQTRWVFNDSAGNRSEFLCSAGSGCTEQ